MDEGLGLQVQAIWLGGRALRLVGGLRLGASVRAVRLASLCRLRCNVWRDHSRVGACVAARDKSPPYEVSNWGSIRESTGWWQSPRKQSKEP
jgi:hypothetical protein